MEAPSAIRPSSPRCISGPRPSATVRAEYRPAVPDGTRGPERGLRGVAGLPARTKAVKKQKGAHGALTGTHHVQWRYTPTRQAPPTGTRGPGVVDDGGRAQHGIERHMWRQQPHLGARVLPCGRVVFGMKRKGSLPVREEKPIREARGRQTHSAPVQSLDVAPQD